ncbi:SDR family oxidoreductase [Cutibacterium acnes]|uniref:3-oxoacyl-ACP reductase FabG n=1 Tax=Cutibacterium acnes TaxID=1747 RepID=UPI000E2270FB|nr:3-oxoacyl-ACP reductase FabG [Cutibacterium acnes]REB13093.1 beta-ketoacyl-ACP reductase [Cutibacterium acnes]TLG23509.1 SDR family oxidoreductase [Cutibacterium acnes]TLG30568.1 SDR family oxidoreductase [Cutibacterium acnes]TMT43875.1 beta-ketoacyl-ACP reductase [Cutibacterium acnes]TMT47437.1 beta-ketoacyl-ACP reductase [Cutibacterium acnes]
MTTTQINDNTAVLRDVFPAGSVAFVSGASRGIGAACATALAAAGCNLAITYRRKENEAAQIAESIEAIGRQCITMQMDVTDENQVTRAFRIIRQHYGRLDAAVLNSGITSDGHLATMSRSKWSSVIDTNLTGTFLCTREATKAMYSSGGSIVMVASTSGVAGRPGQANYAASKGGIVAMMKTLAPEVAAKNVRVNAVAPGFIHTDMVAAVPKAALAQAIQHIPMGRLGLAQEVASAVTFLASPLAAYITGKTLTIDGGMING